METTNHHTPEVSAFLAFLCLKPVGVQLNPSVCGISIACEYFSLLGETRYLSTLISIGRRRGAWYCVWKNVGPALRWEPAVLTFSETSQVLQSIGKASHVGQADNTIVCWQSCLYEQAKDLQLQLGPPPVPPLGIVPDGVAGPHPAEHCLHFFTSASLQSLIIFCMHCSP